MEDAETVAQRDVVSFVRNYMELHEELFEANEQYEESIAEYVDCGTGELG
ncbi:hypothetical protein [Nocardiopsis sp. JB363]|nr:hypothetical protein [Nocardiopsis sp. JB363]